MNHLLFWECETVENYQPDSEIKELIISYLGGDAQAGGTLLNQYDSMITYYIKKFFTSHDLWAGWSIDDVAQMARLHILQYLNKYKMEKCPFPHYIKISTYRACKRYMRFISMEMRDIKKNEVYDCNLGRKLVDWTVKNPADIVVERELFDYVQAEINQLGEVCQQVYLAMLNGQAIYGKHDSEIKRIPEWLRLASVRKIRQVVREVLESYR